MDAWQHWGAGLVTLSIVVLQRNQEQDAQAPTRLRAPDRVDRICNRKTAEGRGRVAAGMMLAY